MFLYFLQLLDLTIGLRLSPEDEFAGSDVIEHGMRVSLGGRALPNSTSQRRLAQHLDVHDDQLGMRTYVYANQTLRSMRQRNDRTTISQSVLPCISSSLASLPYQQSPYRENLRQDLDQPSDQSEVRTALSAFIDDLTSSCQK